MTHVTLFLTVKLHTHVAGFEPMTSTSTHCCGRRKCHIS